MNSFAAINIPQLDQIFLFDESEDGDASMYIENFGASKKICFQIRKKNSFPKIKLNNSDLTSISEEDYIKWVQYCISNIQNGEFSKLVAAQRMVESCSGNLLDFQRLFKKLILFLPNTFVYLFYINGEIWLGASPEIIGIYKKNSFTTISIAGTKKEEEFTEKEKEEQAIVSNFISSQFTHIALKRDSVTRVQEYGEIRHLVNEYEYKVNKEFDFEKAIHNIHPSPALAGFPVDKSIDFISKFEPIDRDFYCGLVSLSIQNEKYSFATIRCARLTANQIAFYAGAGITKDSCPEAEWLETLEKMEVLKKVLFNK